MQMRWYQHSGHGTKCAISERYRLPSVVTSATANANQTALRADVLEELARR